MSVRLKVCGIRSAADLDACVRAKVHALGFNFYERSKRFVPLATAVDLAREVPPDVWKIGVFVGASPAAVGEHVRSAGLSHAQLHGDERLLDYGAVPAALIQVIRVKDRRSLEQTPSPLAAMVLLDTFVDGFGGAGASFDWRWVADATRTWGLPVVLAGGLTPDNVGEAIRQARPWGVDVASGVESSPGVKDPARVLAFAQAVSEASAQLAGSER